MEFLGNSKLQGLPLPKKVSSALDMLLTYVYTGDEAFPLEKLVKPYPKASLGIKERVANYRIKQS